MIIDCDEPIVISSIEAPRLGRLQLETYDEIQYPENMFVGLPQLEIISLCGHVNQDLVRKISPLRNLKNLVVAPRRSSSIYLDLACIFSLVKAAPLMRKLSVQFQAFEDVDITLDKE